jgi:UDP-GlcNAc3NAcA epimerase
MKIGFVVGNRPQFIKLSVLWPIVSKEYECILIHTGQHYSYNLSGLFFEELRLPSPNYNLQVGSGTHSWQVGNIMIKLYPILSLEKPDLLCIIGDTNSSLAATLVGTLTGNIPIAHIEAGARSYNNQEIEEQNRKIIDSVTSYYLCPTEQAAENLKLENISKNRIFIIGDLLHDAIDTYLDDAINKSSIIESLDIKPAEYALFTLHKPINTLDKVRLKQISEILNQLQMPVVWPIHPGTRANLEKFELLNQIQQDPNIRIIEPVSYYDMLLLELKSRVILTDSSGIQREAHYLRKPMLILSKKTEHRYILEENFCKLLDLDDRDCVETAKTFLEQTKNSFCLSHLRQKFSSRASTNILKALSKIRNQIMESPFKNCNSSKNQSHRGPCET